MESQRVGVSFHYQFNLEATGTRREVFFVYEEMLFLLSVTEILRTKSQRQEASQLNPDFKKLLSKRYSI